MKTSEKSLSSQYEVNNQHLAGIPAFSDRLKTVNVWGFSKVATTLWLPALLFIITTVAFLLILRAPPEWKLDVGSPGDNRFLYGFSVPEVENDGTATFRWSLPGARFVLHGANARPSIVEMRLYNDPRRPIDDQQLVLERDEQQFVTMDIMDGWRVYRFLPPGDAFGTGLTVKRIELTSATNRPGAHDGRRLGVVIDWIRVVPFTGSFISPLGGVPLQRALVLTWGVAVLAGGVWRISRTLLPHRRRFALAQAYVIAGGVALALMVWAWHNPYTLAWTLPGIPWTLGIITLVLIGGKIVATLRALIAAARERRQIEKLPAIVGWVGLGLLVIAQWLLNQWTIGIGIGLALGSLLLLMSVYSMSQLPHTRPWSRHPDACGITRTQSLLLLTVIFVVALGLRLYRLADLPYGLWRDEARHGLIALRLLNDPDYHPIYVASGRVNMPALGFYPFALSLKLFGVHDWSMRPVVAVAGAVTVFPLYGLVAHIMRRRDIALLAAALLAASSWHLTLSRFSFPTIFDPLFSLLGLWLLLIGLEYTRDAPAPSEHRQHAAVQVRQWLNVNSMPGVRRAITLLLSGICIGVAVQTYHTGRLAPGVAGLLALLMLLRDIRRRRVWLASMLVVGIGFTLAVAPLMAYVLEKPDAFNDRVGGIFLLRESALKGRSPPAVLDDEALKRHLLMFNVRGDNNGRHHAPDSPMLDFVTGLGFLMGCATLLRYWRDWRSMFLLGALGITLIPSALAVDSPHAMRSIGAVGFACTIAALGWAEIGRGIQTSWGRTLQQQQPAWLCPQFWMPTAGLMVVLIALGLNSWLYFAHMAIDSRVWGSFYPVHTQVGTYLRDLVDEEGPEALNQVYIPEGLMRNSVLIYMTHGLPVKTFNEASLPRLAQSEHRFILSGYTLQKDKQLLSPYLGSDPVPLVRGPDFPNRAQPSFAIYEIP